MNSVSVAMLTAALAATLPGQAAPTPSPAAGVGPPLVVVPADVAPQGGERQATRAPAVGVAPVTEAAQRGDDGEPGSPVPEPTTLLLVGSGLVGLAVSSRRWRRSVGRSGA